ncbi:hypothetical protein BDN71DRAFT_1505824 [Pleurotus eryngii]|uniref:Ribonuclease H1 N-terminal domain-containing protein n=1 Tax=Pleurotus eryngii TaxID=5323 RepID=A0A9P6D9F8_PLEER|nr:hypothetical protein BDN71DRAFT_1505824 [Pleurotus eryngii]
MNVAELVTLLHQHGISPPGKAEATSGTTDASTAPTSTTDAAADALAIEPEEVTLDTGAGFIRCPNCHSALTMFAAVASSTAASTPAASTATSAPAASTTTSSPVASPPVSATQPSPITSVSRTPCWYAVTCGREIGVFYSWWDGHIKNLVNNVPNWNAVRFATEAEARHYYQLQETARNTLAVAM